MTPKARLLARVLISHFVDGYRLSPDERREESERLLASIETVLEAEAENLEHRSIKQTGGHV